MILVLTLRNLLIPWMSVCSQKTSQIAKIQSLKRIYVLLQWRWLSCQCVKIKVISHVSCPTNWHIWSNDLFSVIIISVPSLGPKLFLWWLSDKSKSVFFEMRIQFYSSLMRLSVKYSFDTWLGWYVFESILWGSEKRPLKAFFNTEPRPCQFSVIQSKNFFSHF